MKRWFRDSWLGTVVLAGVVMLALTLLIVTVVDAVAMPLAPASGASWNVPLQEAEAALVRGDLAAALRHWREAHTSVLATRRWEGLVEVGDVYRRIGARAGFHALAVGRARDCYLTALLRARGEGSLDGVLRATEAFIDLGDADVVQHALDIARHVAERDPDPRGRTRVSLLAARWAARATAAREDSLASPRSAP